MEKRTLIIVFATLLLFAVGGFGAYFLFTSPEQEKGAETTQITERISQPKEVSTQPEETTSQPKEPTTTESVDTSDWEIYRNEEFGFEIRFPRILSDMKRTYSTGVVGGINFRLPTQALSDPFERYQFYGRRGYQYVQPDPCIPIEGGEHTEKNIGGVRFIRTEIKPSAGTRGLLAIEIQYLGSCGNICYHLTYIERLPIDEEVLEANVKLFERIVSTFTLIN